jgi:hypothetical protein
MDASVPRTCGFVSFLDGAWGHKDMLESLAKLLLLWKVNVKKCAH